MNAKIDKQKEEMKTHEKQLVTDITDEKKQRTEKVEVRHFLF